MTDQPSELDMVVGKNAVLAFLQRQAQLSDQDDGGEAATIHKIYIADGMRPDARLEAIKRAAKQERVQVVVVDRRKLDKMVSALPGAEDHHQGVIAQMSQVAPLQLSKFLQDFEEKRNNQTPTNPLIVIVDQIEDPHNLGAIIRVAEAAGAKAILLPERRSAGVTWAVAKSSAGASAVLPVVSIANVVRALEKLKQAGFWIAGLAHDAKQTYFEADLKRPLAVVIGNEGYGLTRLVAENCDLLLRIPMLGQTESLNASVAAGIVLYDFVRQNVPVVVSKRQVDQGGAFNHVDS
jgi:23S rRNA (guanosine2251-2'-O)-methyltransferase